MIPKLLRDAPRWVLWKYNADQKKLPYQANHPEVEAKVNDPDTWSDYETARTAFEAGHSDGVGFVLGEGIAGVDIDDCRDPKTGTLTPAARAIVAGLDSYAEVSPSGQGVKIYVQAWLGKNHVRKGLECYAARRYFCVTGNHLAGTPDTLEARGDELTTLIEKEFGIALEDDIQGDEPAGIPEQDLGDPDAELMDGGRNNALTRLAGSLRRVGLDDEEMLAAMLVMNEKRCKPPLPRSDVVSIARSVGRYAPSKAERAIDWMNAKHAVLIENGRAIIITERMDATFNRMVIDRAPAADLHLFYMNKTVNLKVNGKRVTKTLSDYWLRNAARREYTSITFDPEQRDTSPDVYNLWRGFSVTPKPGSWNILRDHLHQVGAAGDDAVFRYLEGWLARLVQRPGVPAETAWVMRGPQGAGKGMIARAIGKLFGQHFIHISQIRHLVGNFNAHLQDVVLVLSDEAVWGGDKVSEGALKTLITEPTLFIERKGKDAFAVPNRVHLIMATNSEWATPMGMDDRRFIVSDVPSTYVGHHDYFKKVAHELSHGGYEAMLHDLLAYDLKTFNHRKAPKTAAGLQQKLHGLSATHRWWFDKLQTGRLLAWHTDWQPSVARRELHDDYALVLQKAGVQRRNTETELSKILAEQLCPGLTTVRRMVPVNGATEKRYERCWVLPSLSACRKHFDTVMHQPVAWDDVGEDGGAHETKMEF